MSTFSHCVLHDTFPEKDEPCYACINQFGDSVTIQAENKKLKEQVRILKIDIIALQTDLDMSRLKLD